MSERIAHIPHCGTYLEVTHEIPGSSATVSLTPLDEPTTLPQDDSLPQLRQEKLRLYIATSSGLAVGLTLGLLVATM